MRKVTVYLPKRGSFAQGLAWRHAQIVEEFVNALTPVAKSVVYYNATNAWVRYDGVVVHEPVVVVQVTAPQYGEADVLAFCKTRAELASKALNCTNVRVEVDEE